MTIRRRIALHVAKGLILVALRLLEVERQLAERRRWRDAS